MLSIRFDFSGSQKSEEWVPALWYFPYGYEVLTADHLEYYKAKGLVETIMNSSKKKDRIIRRGAKTKRLCIHGVNHWKAHVMTSLLQPAIFF